MAAVRILQVITDTDRRGAQVFAVDLHEALERRGLSVRTVALGPGRHGDTLDVPVLGRTRLGASTIAALRRELAAADVLVGHGSSALPAGAAVTAGTRIPFVYRQISDSLFWAGTMSRRLRVRLYLRRATAVVALWDGAAQVLSERFGVDPRVIEVIPNGVPAARYPLIDPRLRPAARDRFGLDPRRPTLLYLGALVPEKGADLAVGATCRRPDWQLLVVGDGPERSRLEDLAARQAPGRVRFTGQLGQPADALSAVDAVVLPSRGGDSMPAVLIEAGLSGLPCVTTPIGGIPAIVRHGETGEVVSPGDESALVAGIERALEHARRYGAAARHHCLEHFDIEVVATRWQDVLQRVTASAARHPVAAP